MSSLPPLTDQQRAAVEGAGQSMALTSGAGCGKTLVLARRFTELLLRHQGDDPFDRFVALTFTDKAALEMLARVRSVLRDALAASRSPADRQKLADWITELPSAHISTIHGFCSSLLRRHAVEAGIDPGFAVLADELLAAQMRTDAVEQAVLDAAGRRDDALLQMLAVADLPKVLADVEELVERPLAWRAADYADPAATLERWRAMRQQQCDRRLEALRRDEAFGRELAELADRPCADAGDRLNAFRTERLADLARLTAGAARPEPRELERLSAKAGNIGSAKCWGGMEALKAYRQRLSAVLARIGELADCFEEPNEHDEMSARFLAVLADLARRAHEAYGAAKRRQGLLDFDDLLGLTGKLLAENEPVRLALRRRLGQLLVDEAQDTDAFQLHMLWQLVSGDDQPPPDKLFIVGDVKQSIYRFRGAQAEVFDELCRRFGPRRLPLSESFRTHEAGVQFVNHVFAKLMPGYEPIGSKRPQRPAGPSVEILLASCGEDADAASAVEAQAELTAQRIAEMIGREPLVWDRRADTWRPVRAGDVAILFARMTNSPRFERALQRRDIPFYVVAGTGFFHQQEVFDILNVLRAIDNPLDDVALVGCLRSMLFGLDDNALLALALAARPPYFEQLARPEVLARLPEIARPAAARAHDLLARLHRQKDALGPDRLVEVVLAETGLAAGLLTEFGGRRKLGNVQRLLAAARAARQSGMTLADFVRHFSRLVLSESRYEQAAVAGEADDVVRLMTVHKAKGLEFPVVFVPDLNAKPRGHDSRLLLRHDWGITYKPPVSGDDDARPVSHAVASAAEKAELAAEAVRKLYVAMTRHEDHLVLVGADWRTDDGSFRDGECYLRQLDGVLGLRQALEAGQETIEYGGGLRARVAVVEPKPPAPSRHGRPLGARLADEAADPAALARALAGVAGVSRITGILPVSITGVPPVSITGILPVSAAGVPPAGITPGGTLRGAVPPVGSTAGCDAAMFPLLGPLPARAELAGAGSRIAATALGDFQHCPMLYHWRYELRVPALLSLRERSAEGRVRGDWAPPLPSGEGHPPPGGGGVPESALDAASAGTLFHRCMELLDFDAGADGDALPAQARALVPRVLAEMELEADPAGLAAELADMLRTLQRQELFARLRAARARLSELSFFTTVGGLEISGQIDLLYQDAGGDWHVVDYKSDRLEEGEDLAAHAARYETQMLLYLDAAGRRLQAEPLEAMLYFLRLGQAHVVPAGAARREEIAARLAALADELVTARRRGQYRRRQDEHCRHCPYGRLCLRLPAKPLDCGGLTPLWLPRPIKP